LISLDKKEQENKKIEKANLDMVLKIVEENDKLKILNMVKNIIIALLIGFITIPYLFPDSIDLITFEDLRKSVALTIDTMKDLFASGLPILVFLFVSVVTLPLIRGFFR